MTTDLTLPQAQLTPRQAWLKNNGIVLQTTDDFGIGIIHIASVEGKVRYATGETEDDALESLISMHNLTPFEG